ncbi:DNA polymerase III, delta subunit [Peptostreptococcaceae bacterium AS15]|nr:DNA polymerase III, delta subunit [Peptostreptococcaceae bacterium AS15]
MSDSDLLKDLSDKFFDVCLVYGEERYEIEKFIENMKESLSESFRQLNFISVDSEYDVETNIDFLINSCESVPFMDEKRVVLVKNSNLFQTSTTKIYSNDDIIKLKNYLENPLQSTRLVFAPTKVDKRSELYKLINKKYEVINCDRLDKIGFSRWVSNRFKEKNITIDNHTKDYFIQRCGYLNKDSQVTLLDVESEIEKLRVNKTQKNLSIEDIEKLNLLIEENNVFKYIDYLFSKDREKVYNTTKQIIFSFNSILVLSLIGRQISLLMKIYILRKNGCSQESIAKILSLQAFVIKKDMIQLKKYTFDELLSLYNLCSELDYRIKKGLIKDSIGLEVMVNKICKN